MLMTISAPLLSWRIVLMVRTISENRSLMIGMMNATLLSVALWAAIGFAIRSMCG